MAREITLHETDIILNRDKLDAILEKKGITYKELWTKVLENYGLDISYKGFMNLFSNRVSWKLLYAYVITEVLSVETRDIFDIVKVDTEKLLKEKEEWKRKYEKGSR